MNKICHFEIPWLPAHWCAMDETRLCCKPMVYASPALPDELFLKERHFEGRNEKDWGRFLSALTSGVPATAGKPKHGSQAADDCNKGSALKPRNFLNHGDRRTWA